MNEKKVPGIRFKGFEDDWEQRKVGELTTELTEYATMNSKLPLFTSSRNGLMYQSECRGSLTTNSKKTMFSVVPLGACTYRHMSDDDIFHLNINTLEKGIVSREYPVFVATDKNDIRFIVQFINSSPTFLSFCTQQKKGGTRTRLYYKTLCDFKMMVPETTEQKKIANFFQGVDQVITLHQRKLEKLKIVKKSMLENCFPKNGEKVPKFRFAGFTDDWEQRKLSDVVGTTYGGGTPATYNDAFWNGDIPWIQTSNTVEDQLFDIEVNKCISNDGLNHSAAQMIPGNSVAVVTHVGVGKLVFMPYSYTTSQDFISLSNLKCNPKFLCYALYRKLREDLHIVQGSAIKGITKEDLMTKQFAMPEIEEQGQIASTLELLDDLITLHQRKLDKLNKIKKSMLKSMFV